MSSSIYRGMNIWQSPADGKWRWATTNHVESCAAPFDTETEAMNDVDRHKRQQRAAKPPLTAQ